MKAFLQVIFQPVIFKFNVLYEVHDCFFTIVSISVFVYYAFYMNPAEM